MSKKFYDKLLRGDCYTEKPFHSKFGANILKKFGWTEGNGLGKEGHGRVNCVQVRKKTDNLGIGANSITAGGVNEWNNWWDDMYNDVANEITQNKSDTDTSESDKEISDVKVSTDVCILDICEGRTCRKGDREVGKLKRIRQDEAIIKNQRRKKPDETSEGKIPVSSNDDSCKLSSSVVSTIKSSISDRVKPVRGDKVKSSYSRTSSSDGSSAAVLSTIITSSNTKKKQN